MIGDREYDIIGAKENGLDYIGVLYWYVNREELLKAWENIYRGNAKGHIRGFIALLMGLI